jgi:hypothetical protein
MRKNFSSAKKKGFGERRRERQVEKTNDRRVKAGGDKPCIRQENGCRTKRSVYAIRI